MPPSRYKALGLFISILGLLLGSIISAQAQTFTLSANSLKMAVFYSDQSFRNSYRDIVVQSNDPDFDYSKLTIFSPDGVGLYPMLLDGGRRIRINAYYGAGQDNEVKVTIRSPNQSSIITVSRFCFAKYRTPKVLFSADQLYIYALYQDVILMFDARTRDLLAKTRLPIPADTTFEYKSGRSLTFSSDGNELHVFISGFSSSLFRFSRATLAPLPTITLPPNSLGFPRRVFIGERAGHAYFAQFDAGSSDWGAYETFYDTSLLAYTFPEGKLVQKKQITPPGVAYLGHFQSEEFVLHPTRAELWIRERYRGGIWGRGTCLRRVLLTSDGLTSDIPSECLRFGQNYATSTKEPWLENPSGLLLTRGSDQVIVGSALVRDSEPSPIIVRPLPVEANFISAGNIAASEGQIIRIDTGELFPSLILSNIQDSGTFVGLSNDGRSILTVGGYSEFDPTPKVHFLPARIAALESSKARSPLAGSIVAPTTTLSWYALPGPDRYRVYLSTREDEFSTTTPSPSLILAEPGEASLTLPSPLSAGAIYYWRVDAIYGDRIIIGDVQTFSVSRARVDTQPLEVSTLVGARRRDFSVPVMATSSDVAWRIVSDTPWVSVRMGAGVGTGTAELSIDAGALAAGIQTATLNLITSDGSVPISLGVNVVKLSINTWTTLAGGPRIVGVGQTVTTNKVNERFLFSIDAATEQLRLCATIPESMLPVSISKIPIIATTYEHPFYIFFSSGTFGEFDQETLALKRVVKSPFDSSQSYIPSNIRPGDNGRIWMLDNRNRIALLNPDTGKFDFCTSNEIAAEESHQSDNGQSLFTYTINRDPQTRVITTTTFRRYDIVSDRLELSVEKTIPVKRETNPDQERPVWGGNPMRFSYAGIVYNEAIEQIDDLCDKITFVAPDASAVLGDSMIYLGDKLAEAHILPRFNTFNRLTYDPASRKLITITDPEGKLYFHKVESLPLVTPVRIMVRTVIDTVATFDWEQPPTAVDIPDFYYSPALEFRKIDSDEPWRQSSFYVSGLTPETTYEARGRASQGQWRNNGPVTRWSPIITFTTAVAHPSRGSAVWPQYQDFTLGSSISLPLSAEGKNLVWEVSGMPPGLSFNPDTRTLEGKPDTPGSYTIEIKVSNSGGSFTHSLAVRVTGSSYTSPNARYAGLIDPSGGPLTGLWTLARDGLTVSGTYKTPLFTQPFKAVFGEAGLYYYPYSMRRSTRATVTYKGVKVNLRIDWILDTDRIEITASTFELVNNFSAGTTPDTGLASHWAAGIKPHPYAGRYTALLYPGEGTGPEGTGFLILDIDASGTATMSGETALGQKFTQSLPVSDFHTLPFYNYSDNTLALGGMEISKELAPSPRLVGELFWVRYQDPKSNVYRTGFEQQIMVFGAPLPTTGKLRPPLAPLANPANRAILRISGGGLYRLSKPIIQNLSTTPVGLSAPKAGAPQNPNRIVIKLDPATGIVTGTAAIVNAISPKPIRTLTFRGIVLKNLLEDSNDLVGGYFLLTDENGMLQSGLVEITEPESAPTE